MLTEVEEVLIVLFLSDREPSLERKHILNTDNGWKTVNLPIKELDTPPPMTKVMKGNFDFEPDNSKCKSHFHWKYTHYIEQRERTLNQQKAQLR